MSGEKWAFPYDTQGNAHCFPACRRKRLKGCPDGCASTAWDSVHLLCNLYWNAGRKRCPLLHMVQPLFTWCNPHPTPFYTWCNMLLTGLHRSPIVSIHFLLLSNSFILPLHLPSLFFLPLRARELGAIIYIRGPIT